MLAGDVLKGERGELMQERERWKDIARLEERVIERLQQVGLGEPEASKIKASQKLETAGISEKNYPDCGAGSFESCDYCHRSRML